MSTSAVIVNNIKLSVNASYQEAFSVAKARLKRAGIFTSSIRYSIYRRSIDARKRGDIHFVYSVLVEGAACPTDDRISRNDIVPLCSERPIVKHGTISMKSRPVVVGSGPCGLFAALLLAENGYRPILIERGGSVEERKRAISVLKEKRILDAETNVQFGAGGAGTFSDGKLVTRINDPMTAYILERLVEFGAPREISYIAKPHIGTDILAQVVDAMLERITGLGGEVMYHTRFESLNTLNNSVVGIKTSRGDFEVGALVLAVGHSARDTYVGLMASDVELVAKPFSVGMRIEHLAADIDKALYGDFAGHPALGHAEYNLSYDTKARGVYTFCMCPGGVVVPATSEHGGVVVNGMSYSGRDGVNSNAAVVCSIFKEDYGSNPLAAIEFQRKIERAAFLAGGSDYSAPVITVGDFLDNRLISLPSRIMPSYMDGDGIRIASPKEYLPDFVTSQIKNAIRFFDTRISGFAARDAVLTGAETRTSAPVRILRDPDTRLAIGYDNFYPAGEGAGYAGGITSASIDGVRCALSLMEKFAPYHG